MTRWHVGLADGADIVVQAETIELIDDGALIFYEANQEVMFVHSKHWRIVLRDDADAQHSVPPVPPAKTTPRAV